MRRVMGKTVALAAVATAAALTATGCSATSGGGEPQSDESAAPSGELEFWTINLKEGYQDYIEGLIADYEADHDGVTINWVDVSDYQQTQTRLISALASGDIPEDRKSVV